MEKLGIMNSLKDIINIRCDMFKDKVAFLEKDMHSTEFKPIKYSKMKEDVNSLGTIMLKKFNLKDKKVAVIGENSYRWYITYMAVACGVGVIAPLDKELPENEILNLVERSGADCIVYSTRKKELVENLKSKLSKEIIFIEMNKEVSDDTSYSFDELVKEGKELLDTGNTEYIDIEIDREEFKVLLFTSGTTASPKGVMLNHKNLCSNAYSCSFIVPQIGQYTYLSVLPMHHTYEFLITYIYGTSMGATIGICEGLKYVNKNFNDIKPDVICVVPALVEKINSKIEKAIKETGKENVVGMLSKVTTGLNKVGIDLRRSLFKRVQENFGGNLKYLFCGAAPLDKEIIKKMEGYGFTLYEGYGVTEASPLISASYGDKRSPGTVGKAVYGVEIRIDLSENDDENSNVGEVIVKGDNVMMGYYENEEETSKVLKKGWYYTGDMGYFDLQGNLVISGRCKNMLVTSNGKNIYPEELEYLINKIPYIEESMVYGIPDKDNKTEVIVSVKVTLNNEYIDEKFGANRPSNEKLHDMIWEEIKKINRTLVSYKAIKKLEIKEDEFVKTTTMKIKRFAEIKK